ncbi:hypothetical protein AB5V95_02340 [Metamycoplasma spumans]|uniref:hypothetical protein n=1 Tax=Metamycoplasma spumans TaxID=92406 RepID=UPI0034DDC6A3
MKYKKIEIQNLTDFEKKRKDIYTDITNGKLKINQIAIKHEVSRFTVSKIKKSINFDGTFNVSHKNKGNKYRQKFSDNLVDSEIERIRDFSSFVFDQPTDRTKNVTMAIYYRTKGSIMSLKTLYRRTLKEDMQQNTRTNQLEKKLKETQEIF